MRDKEVFFKLGGTVIVIAFVIWLSFANISSDKAKIQVWADENNMVEVVSIEHTAFARGPFWIKEDHHRIYKVVIIDSTEHQRVTWFRFGGWFGYDQEWE